MDEIIIFEGADLDYLVSYLESIVELKAETVYRVRFTVDEGGLKIKVNEHIWSPALGKQEVRSGLA